MKAVLLALIFSGVAYAQIVPGSSGHGAPGFSCAANDTYKDIDSDLVWKCGPGNNNWQPTPQYDPWSVPTLGQCKVGNGTTWVTGSCAGASAVSSVYGRTGAIAAQTGDYTAAQVTNAADTSAAGGNVFVGPITVPQLNVNSGANSAVLQWAANQFLFGTSTIFIDLSSAGTVASAGFQSNLAELGLILTTTQAAVPYSATPTLETNPANFLDASNNVELQFGEKKGAGVPAKTIAFGDVTNVVQGNVKFPGNVAMTGQFTIPLMSAIISGTIAASSANNFVPATGTLNLSATEGPRETVLPTAGTVHGFTACINAAQSATGSLVYTYRVGTLSGTMANTTLVVTVAASAATGCYSDNVHSFTYTAGQAVDVQITNNATTNAAVTTNIWAYLN